MYEFIPNRIFLTVNFKQKIEVGLVQLGQKQFV